MFDLYINKMGLIDNFWKRLIICLIFAGFLSKMIGKVTNQKVEMSALIVGTILYFILLGIYRRHERRINNS